MLPSQGLRFKFHLGELACVTAGAGLAYLGISRCQWFAVSVQYGSEVQSYTPVYGLVVCCVALLSIAAGVALARPPHASIQALAAQLVCTRGALLAASLASGDALEARAMAAALITVIVTIEVCCVRIKSGCSRRRAFVAEIAALGVLVIGTIITATHALGRFED